MGFDDRLIQQLVVKRSVPVVDVDGNPVLDEYSQPTYVPGGTTVATVPGLIQPRSAREVAAAAQSGAVIGEHLGFIRPLAGISTHDWVELAGVRFDIISVSDAGGQGHHLELGLRRIA